MEELMDPVCVGNTGKWVKTNEVGEGENDSEIVTFAVLVMLLDTIIVLEVVLLKVFVLEETVMVGVAS
jgi:hypothetical protein